MDAFLRGILRDIERRAEVLRDRIAAIPADPDLGDYSLSSYRLAEAVRRTASSLLDDSSLGVPSLLVNHLRTAQDLERRSKLIESYFVPFLERYGDTDRRVTRLCRRLAEQVRWPLSPPLVLTFSSQYYWTVGAFNLISAPAAEGSSLLRLPDLCHEMAHILYEHNRTQLTSDFVQELANYVEQERKRATRGQRPREYLRLYDPLFAQWRDAWLVEFVADMIATYLVGTAFGWQHVRLCSGEGQAVYRPALGEASTHPADEARLRGVLAVLSRMGSSGGPKIKALWDSYLMVHGEVRPADYDICYPQLLLESLADYVIVGCQALGLRAFHETNIPGNPHPDIPCLIMEGWDRFLENADAYAAWEKTCLGEVWASLGL